MKTVLVVSYNNLDTDFWKDHLGLASNDHIIHLRGGSTVIQNPSGKLDLIIVDDYFSPLPTSKNGSREALMVLKNLNSHTPAFHVSPTHGQIPIDPNGSGFYESNFNQNMIDLARGLLSQKNVAAS